MSRKKSTSTITEKEMEKQLRIEIKAWLKSGFYHRLNTDELLRKARVLDGIINQVGWISPQIHSWLCQLTSNTKKMEAAYSEYKTMVKASFKEMTRVIRRAGGNNIRNLQLFSKIFLEEYRQRVSKLIPVVEEDWLTDEDIQVIGNLAVAVYLETWLRTDRSTFLTIEKFSQFGYRKADKGIEPNERWESRKSAYFRAYEKYVDLHSLQREVEKERGEKPRSDAYKIGNERKLSLPVLAWCEAIAKDELDIMEVLFFKKHLLNRKSMHDSKQNIRLQEALHSFKSLLENTMVSYPKDGSDIDGYKKFVAKCIMINTVERQYRFVLAGRIAEYAKNHMCTPSAYNKTLFTVFFGQNQDDTMILMGRKSQLDKNGKKKYALPNLALDTLGYDRIVDLIFEQDGGEETEKLIDRELLRRTAISNLIDSLYSACSFKQRTWTDADFRDAAEFFYNQYPILFEFTNLEVPETEEKAQTYYDYYHFYYIALVNDETTLARRIIENMTS